MAENLLQQSAQHDPQAHQSALQRARDAVEQARLRAHERKVAGRRAAIAAHEAEAAARRAPRPDEQAQHGTTVARRRAASWRATSRPARETSTRLGEAGRSSGAEAD